MKKMRAKIVAIVMVLALALVGCSYEAAMKINSDGSMEASYTAFVKKADYDKELAEQGMTMKEMMEGSGLKYEQVTVDGVEFYKIDMGTEKYSEKDVQKSLDDNEIITKDTYYEYMKVTTEDVDSLSVYGDSATQVRYTISIEFSEPIVSTNGKIDSENPNKVIFEFDLVAGKNVEQFATTRSNVDIKSCRDQIKERKAVAATKVKKVKNIKGKKAKVTLSKVKNATYYTVQYGKKSSFKGAKKLETKKASVTLKKLTLKKKYYVRARAVKVLPSGNEYFSKWSKAKKVKIKK